MATSATRMLTFEEWATRPETSRIEELIDGELVVTEPRWNHQVVVLAIGAALREHAQRVGDGVVPAPFGIRTGERTVVQPDLVYFRRERIDFAGSDHRTTSAPDLVVEVLSPSNRAHDLVRKRRIFEQHGIREVWFVDVDAPRIEQLTRGAEGSFGRPIVHEPGDTLTSTAIEGLTVDVAGVLSLD
ncbi:MAG TPA: Uma2 family endonuclease [Nitriliruptorales bacterium]|jgi:Uma2 family endonuclease